MAVPPAHNNDNEVILLPEPTPTPQIELLDLFESRRSIRDFDPTPLPLQVISNVLWAGYGINRTTGPFGVCGRTAASASNSQEIVLYVATADGVYLYDAAKPALKRVLQEDLRKAAFGPRQSRVAPQAPMQIYFVVDIDRLTHTTGFDEPGLHDQDVQKSYYFVDTGLIAGNIYIYAAATGLATWFHNCDKGVVTARLNLPATRKPLFAQSVGYPPNSTIRLK